jgi:peptidyl-dipeptidase Dcp
MSFGEYLMEFGPSNPFYAPSALPFQAPAFDKIRDEDYLPALEAGMAEQLAEIQSIADSAEPATFENTFVTLEKSGRLLDRAGSVFSAVTSANTNPVLQAVEAAMAPKLAAHSDAIFLNDRLYRRIEAVYSQRATLGLDAESLRLVEYYYREFVHAGANLSPSQKTSLTALNEELSTLQNAFRTKLLAATKAEAFVVTDAGALDGLTEGQVSALKCEGGWTLPLQNTTQQPYLADLRDRATRQALFAQSWNRTERGGEQDTRTTILRVAALRAEKARLLGFPSFAAWKLEDQMARDPETALQFLDGMVVKAREGLAAEAADVLALLEKDFPGAALEPWDWEYYSQQVRQAKFDVDEAEVRPYFEVNRVLEDGVFYAATQLYGLTFQERTDLPVYHPDVRVFTVIDADGTELSLFYTDFFKRDNKNGGAWMSSLVSQAKLLGTLPVIYNTGNFTKPAAGEPALISFSDVTTMFHEFGHTLHGMFSEAVYPSLAGTSVARDFVEFPSQFNEHWAVWPSVFQNYVRHWETGEPMPAELASKLIKAQKFEEGYRLAEVLAAAELDMQWHTAGGAVADAGEFEQAALTKTGLAIRYAPPRYRSSYFSHIWAGGYAAGYYAYLWAEKLEDDGWAWFEKHGGLTRENGERLRRMVLSRGNTEDLGEMFRRWLG